MSLGAKTALAVVAIFAALLAAVTAIAGTVWAILGADERAAVAAALAPHAMPIAIVLIFAGAVLATVFGPLLRSYIVAPDRLAEQLRILVGPNRSHRLPLDDASGLIELARSINELADQRDALQIDVERQIRDSQAKLEEERNRLATLMSELMQGIVACNLDGRILLYNNRARLLFTATAQAGGSALIGLDRSIFAAIERDLIDHALDNVRRRLQAGAPRPAANFVTAGPTGQLLRVQMAAVLANAETATDAVPISGYVLVLENITRAFESESRRDELLQLLTEGSRASLANIRVAVETLTAYADMTALERERFIAVIDEEVQRLSARIDEAASRHADALQARWVLEEMRCSDFASATQAAIANWLGVAVRAEQIEPDLWIRVDSFALIRALAYVVGRLKNEYGIENLRLRITRTERLAQLDLTWPGTEPVLDALQAWDRELMRIGAETSPLTLRDVAERHDGEVWFQREGPNFICRFLLPVVDHEPEPTSEQPAREDRPEYYDFDLFKRSGESRALDQRQLADLTFTVFDLETTGLAPMQGDEIIQIGAVRIVNMRLLRNETFDQLVDPRRRLDPVSVRVHRITEDMLRGQPTIDEVLPAFHAFCEDTVLIGHNAAFDMRFLQLKEESTRIRFHQPVLDTLLLSAVLHPAQESHRLEDIAGRLGVRITARHSALGDALVTAGVFLKMIGLLAEAGVRTLADAREASAKSYYARLKY
jgi:DNA polymerase III subunit epsilon